MQIAMTFYRLEHQAAFAFGQVFAHDRAADFDIVFGDRVDQPVMVVIVAHAVSGRDVTRDGERRLGDKLAQ